MIIDSPIVTGSLTVSGSITATGNIIGTVSSASYATTASYALTSTSTLQQVLNSGNGASNFGGGTAATIQLTNFTNNRTLYINDNSFPTIRIVDNNDAANNLQIDLNTLSLDGVSYNWSDIVSSTASYVANAQSASYVLTAQTASYVLNAQSASYVLTARSASYILNAVSASYAITASYALNGGSGGGSTTITFNIQTGSYTLAASDVSKIIRVSSSVSCSITLPDNTSVPIATGSFITIEQAGTGFVTAVTGSGVTILPTARTTFGQYKVIQVYKVGTNIWNVLGGII
jgi:hypothetical protein